MNELEKIGIQVRTARENANLTQSQLAEKINISVSHMSDIENGKKEMGILIFKHIVDVLGISANELLQNTAWDKERIGSTEFDLLLDDCAPSEREYLLRMVEYSKLALKKYENS